MSTVYDSHGHVYFMDYYTIMSMLITRSLTTVQAYDATVNAVWWTWYLKTRF